MGQGAKKGLLPHQQAGWALCSKKPQRRAKAILQRLLTHLLLIASDQNTPASPRAPSYHFQDHIHMKPTSKKKEVF